MRTEASREVATPTTAVPNSVAPSCSRASTSVASASTSGMRPVHWRTIAGLASTASTSRPSRSRVAATAEPKRPSPMTSVESVREGGAGMRSPEVGRGTVTPTLPRAATSDAQADPAGHQTVAAPASAHAIIVKPPA